MFQSPIQNIYADKQQRAMPFPMPPLVASSVPSVPMPAPPPASMQPSLAYAINNRSYGQKIKLIAYITFAFFALSNYGSYKILHQILSVIWSKENQVFDSDNAITIQGHLFMMLVFLLVVTILFQRSHY